MTKTNCSESNLISLLIMCWSERNGRRKGMCNKLSTYLSGPMLGKLFGQVSSDASSSTSDQYHLLGEVFPSAWQQQHQTCSYYTVEDLNREKKHTTHALQLHFGTCSRIVCKYVYAASLRAPQISANSELSAQTATSELLQLYPHANNIICTVA